MQRLAQGLVVLFGPKLNHDFVDTLTVIGSSVSYAIGEPDEFGHHVADLFRATIVKPLGALPKLARARAVLSPGLLYGQGRQKMFCFTPTDDEEVWRGVIRQVRAQRIDLAVFLAELPIEPGQTALAGGEGEGCATNQGCAAGKLRAVCRHG